MKERVSALLDDALDEEASSRLFESIKRDAGLRHRRRAQTALLDLPMQIETRRPCGPAALARGFFKRQRDQPLLAVHAQQTMPRGMEFDLIDAIAARVERVEFRRVAVGDFAECEEVACAPSWRA